MEGLMSAVSIVQMAWQWTNQVTLALLLTMGIIQSEG